MGLINFLLISPTDCVWEFPLETILWGTEHIGTQTLRGTMHSTVSDVSLSEGLAAKWLWWEFTGNHPCSPTCLSVVQPFSHQAVGSQETTCNHSGGELCVPAVYPAGNCLLLLWMSLSLILNALGGRRGWGGDSWEGGDDGMLGLRDASWRGDAF